MRDDRLIPVLKLAQQRFGRRPAPSTVWRWCKKGVKGGIKLNAVHVFGTWHCTAADFDRFLQEQTAAAMVLPQVEEPRGERSPETERKLREAGLLK